MSKSVKTDHEFVIDRYAELLAKAQGGRTQSDFARDCGLSVAYICKHLNKRIDKAPIPSTLKKIAAVAANGVTYEELLDAAGYDAAKYTQSGISDIPLHKRGLEFEKLATGTITDALRNSNLKWHVIGRNANSMSSYDLDIEIDNNRVTHWYFNFLTSAPDTMSNMINNQLHRLYTYYGRMVLMPAGKTTKYSFVTDSVSLYNTIINNPPIALAMYISVVLIDIPSLSVIKEEYVRTAFSDNNNDIPLISPNNQLC